MPDAGVAAVDKEAPQTTVSMGAAPAPMGRVRQGLETAIAETEEALAEWGVHPDHPEAKFFRMMMGLLRKTGDLLVLDGEAHEQVSLNLRTIDQRMRSGAASVERSIEQRVEGIRADVDRVVANSIERAASEFGKAAQKWMYVRERRWNQTQLLKLALGGALVLLAATGAGYSWRYTQDSQVMSGRYLCEQSPMIVRTAQGNVLACKLSGLVGARALRDLAERWGASPQ
jgi:hypothetical protein